MVEVTAETVEVQEVTVVHLALVPEDILVMAARVWVLVLATFLEIRERVVQGAPVVIIGDAVLVAVAVAAWIYLDKVLMVQVPEFRDHLEVEVAPVGEVVVKADQVNH
jgi:hypothetical protein